MAQSITPDKELPTILQEKFLIAYAKIKINQYFNERNTLDL